MSPENAFDSGRAKERTRSTIRLRSPIGADLEGMLRDQLVVEVKRLRHGVASVVTVQATSSAGPSGAWSLLPEQSDYLPVIPDWPEFLRGCMPYRQSLDE